MDKILLTNHIRDMDLKNNMYKVIDKANSVSKNYDVRYTDFLNPYEVKNAISILNSNNDIKYSVDGGYEDCERSLIFIYPFYMEYEEIDNKLRYIQIDGNFKFKSVSHKDYLGSIMGLGIKREKIGDILVSENFAQIIVSHDICDYIIMNLEKISRNNVTVREIQRQEIIYTPPNVKEVSFTVSSKRLDCVISGIYNISRQDSLKYITAEKVYVNYEKVTSASKEVESKALISVRGRGRSFVTEIGDLTKKGKIKVKSNIIL